MPAHSGDLVAFVAGLLSAAVAATVLLGLATRYVLLPYLREHLLDPVQETHHQVTENTGESPQPTVLDAIHSVERDVKALAGVMDTHMAWSEAYTTQTERKFRRLRQLIRELRAAQEGTEHDPDSATGPTV